MEKKLKILLKLAFVGFVLLIFKAWFLPGLITGGDFWPYSNSIYETKPLFLYAWDLNKVAGMGGVTNFLLWMYLSFGVPLTIFGNWIGFNWEIIQRIYYLFPLLIFSGYFSYKLFDKIFSHNLFAIFSSAIYLINTYILMVIGGGQISGIGLSYSIMPLIMFLFINTMETRFEKPIIGMFEKSYILGFFIALQTILDIRISYITLSAIFLLWVLKNIEQKNLRYLVYTFTICFLIPGIITLLVNSFWILPTIISRRNPIYELESVYSSLEAVKFFSFAKIEDAISLLHPNWPENIFGKTGFLKPEFLILPILAFSSLTFIKNIAKEKRFYILFFAFLGLVGIFLAKGANEPFGGIYLWLFDNFPGFIMFRDPTKWYTLIALSYSILIPFTVWNMFEYLKKYKRIKYAPQIFLIVVVSFLLFLIRPALLGELSGTFKSTQIPEDYVKLEKFVSSQNSFSRTLWVPTIQRFGFYSNSHPAIPAQNLFKTVENTEIIKKMQEEGTELFLQEAAVKYVVIPSDSQGEIFLKDREYDEKMYLQVINGIDSVDWLKRIEDFGKIKVFEVSNPRDHFWTINPTLNLKYQFVSPVEYKLEVKNAKIGDKIIFSENYDASWIARDNNTKFYDWPNLISSNPYNRVFNSFTLRKAGDYSLIVFYYPQTAVNLGIIISLSSFILVVFLLIFGSKLKKW
jgi:hypothetical protein